MWVMEGEQEAGPAYQPLAPDSDIPDNRFGAELNHLLAPLLGFHPRPSNDVAFGPVRGDGQSLSFDAPFYSAACASWVAGTWLPIVPKLSWQTHNETVGTALRRETIHGVGGGLRERLMLPTTFCYKYGARMLATSPFHQLPGAHVSKSGAKRQPGQTRAHMTLATCCPVVRGIWLRVDSIVPLFWGRLDISSGVIAEPGTASYGKVAPSLQ
jgi:hypothetical protein